MTADALAASQARFRAAIDAVEGVLWTNSADGRMIGEQPAWAALTGQFYADYQGYGWSRAVHPDDAQPTIDAWNAAVAGQHIFKFEHRVRRADGEWRTFSVRAVPIFDADGGIEEWVGVHTDVTDQRADQRRLHASEARLRAVVAAAPVGLIFADAPDGRITGGNTQAERIMRHPVRYSSDVDDYAEWVGFHPDGRRIEGREYPLARALAGEELPEMEALYRRGDGTEAYLRFIAAPVRGENGEIVSAVVASLDIDRERRAEASLRAVNDLLERRFAEALAERKVFADIVDATDSFIQVIDTGMNLVAINCANVAAFERLYGLTPKVGDHLPTLYADHPVLLAGAMAYWKRALAGETFTTVAEVGEHTRAWVEMGFDVLRDANGRTIGAFSFADDISKRRANEVRLAEAEEQLRQAQKMEAVGQLTGGIAHDFNNLLTVVTGNIDMARRAAADGDTARVERMLDNALKGAERAATLTSRLLAFSRRQPLDPKPTDVGRLMTGMSDLLARSLGQSIIIETVTNAGLWRVEVDPPQLENALLNLAINARDAMSGAGRLTIEASNALIDDAFSAAHSGVAVGQYVVIGVGDTGTGMSPETIERAFDPFFTTKQAGKGTGLGLSQVYGFVKQSGGHVKIDSQPGQGTSVKLYLPRFEGAVEVDTMRAETAEPSGLHGETVLVTEDDDDVRAFTVATLAALGYRVIEARNGASALKLLDGVPAAPVGLLLTNVVMPEMSGKDLADAVRSRRPGLPVLFTTGYARDAIVHGGRLDPGVDLLQKPFTQAALAAKLRDVLDRAGLPATRQR